MRCYPTDMSPLSSNRTTVANSGSLRTLCMALSALGFILLLLSARAENWPQWRGPLFNGSSTETGLPVKFSKTNNVKWSVELPGPSAATPIIWGDRVFISSAHQQKKSLWALCLDRKSGQTLWEQEVAPGYSQDRQSNYASPSPATDGKL